MNARLNINHTLKMIILQVFKMVKGFTKSIFKKTTHLPSLHQNYKCKMNHRTTHLFLAEQLLFIKQKNMTQGIDYKQIKKVALQVKWWRIRIKLKCKQGVYTFDFPSYDKAYSLYEELIYKKVANR